MNDDMNNINEIIKRRRGPGGMFLEATSHTVCGGTHRLGPDDACNGEFKLPWEQHEYMICAVRVINHNNTPLSIVPLADSAPGHLQGDCFSLTVGCKDYISDLPLLVCSNEWHNVRARLYIQPKQHFGYRIRINASAPRKAGLYTPIVDGFLFRPVQ